MGNTVQRPNYDADAPVTLMLVGGGIRFPAFIGALQAIENSGIKVSRIIASSTASVVAGMYVNGYSPDAILDEAMALDTRQFKDVSLKAMLTGYGLCSSERLEEWVDKRFGARVFSGKTSIPLEIVATDMLHYRPVVFSAEKSPDLKLSVAAAASSLVPGVLATEGLNMPAKNML
jgi:NTE family protein